MKIVTIILPSFYPSFFFKGNPNFPISVFYLCIQRCNSKKMFNYLNDQILSFFEVKIIKYDTYAFVAFYVYLKKTLHLFIDYAVNRFIIDMRMCSRFLFKLVIFSSAYYKNTLLWEPLFSTSIKSGHVHCICCPSWNWTFVFLELG